MATKNTEKTDKKNLMTRIFCFCISMVFLLIMFLAVTETFVDRGLSSYKTSEVGTEFNPYIIDSVESLLAFADDVNRGNDYSGKTVKLTEDIDLAGILWTPIGMCNGENYFCGTFDGNGHVIKNLTAIDDTMTQDLGFFGMLGGTVINLGFEGGVLQGNCCGVISVGAANIEARIINCYVRGVTVSAVRAGGIVDDFDGTVTRCISDSCILNGQITGAVSSYFVFQTYKDNYSTDIPHPIYSVVTSDCEILSADRLNSAGIAAQLNHDNLYSNPVPGTNRLGYNSWVIDQDGKLTLGDKVGQGTDTGWTDYKKAVWCISIVICLVLLIAFILKTEIICGRYIAVLMLINAGLGSLIPSDLIPPCAWWGIAAEVLAAIFILYFKKSIVRLNKLNLAASLSLLSVLSVFRIPSSGLADIHSLSDHFGLLTAEIICGWTAIIFVPLMIISVYISIGFIRDIISDRLMVHPDRESSKNELSLCRSIIVIISFVFLLSSYPGSWLGDDVHHVLINQAKCGWWNGWFPIGYSLFVYLFAGKTGNGFTVNIVQTLIWILIQFYILNMLAKNRKSLFIYTVLSVIVFTPFLYLEVTVKDTLYAMGMLLFSTSIYSILRAGDKNAGDTEVKKRKKDCIAGICGAVMVSLFRHGGFIITIISAVIILCVIMRNKADKASKKLLYPVGVIITAVAAHLIVDVMIFNMLGAAPNAAYVKYSTPLQMVAAAAEEGVEFRPDDLGEIEKAMPIQNWKVLYNKYWSDSVARSWSNPDIDKIGELIENDGWGKELLDINLWLVINHPVTYFKALANIDSILWEVAEPYDLSGYLVENNEIPDPDITHTGYGKITSDVEKITRSLPIVSDILFRGGFFLCIIGILFCCAVRSGKSRIWVAMIPIIFNEGLLLLAVPTQDTRFILPLIETATFFIAVYFQKQTDL